jgi:hypothetical protein
MTTLNPYAGVAGDSRPGRTGPRLLADVQDVLCLGEVVIIYYPEQASSAGRAAGPSGVSARPSTFSGTSDCLYAPPVTAWFTHGLMPRQRPGRFRACRSSHRRRRARPGTCRAA